MKESFIFKPLARLILQLGDQLIKNEKIALLELVKNAYDADATFVNIKIENIDDPSNGSLIIEDNGIGMNLGLIKNVWMRPGSDYKEKLFKKKEIAPNFKSKFKRIPLGEKGIGRFSAHKLGNKITVISKKAHEKEVVLTFNWNIFKESNYLEDVPIEIIERNAKVFNDSKTGTKIIIENLKVSWSRGEARDIFRALNSLCSPFDSPDSFKVKFEIANKDWLEGLLSWKDLKNYSLYRFKCELAGQEIKTFIYEFTPWETMKKLEYKKITEIDPEIQKVSSMVDRDKNPIDLSKYKIGTVKFEALIFDRSPRTLALGVQDKQGLKEYLDENGGIRIYRDGVRVYDYGEPENDWLNLDIRRVNIPGKRLSNNIVLGAVHLDRGDSEDLVEKTNREGFVQNGAYETFLGAILYVLDKVETFRIIDKDKLRVFYGSTPASEPVVSNINELQDLIKKKVKDKLLKKEINRYLKRIEDNYREISEVFLRSAGAGLSLSVVIHEIEKIIKEMKLIVEKEAPSKRIFELVKHLAQLVEGYSVIIRKTGKKNENLKNIIEQAIFNVEFRLKAHKIEILKGYDSYKGDATVHCARNLVVGSILNIIDNSLWWLDYGEVKNKRIYLTVSDDIKGYKTILIADNGPGFSLPTEEITKPFISGKPDGMGLGLHIVNEVMGGHKGILLFPEEGDVIVPRAFEKGAIIALAFKKED